MALAEILEAMEAEVAAQIRQIEAQAAETVAGIRAAAGEEARQIRERHHGDVLAPLRNERARRLNRARLAALSATSQARERLFAEALERARERLAGARGAPGYPALLRALAQEALAQIDGEALLRADPRDETILRALLPNARVDFDLPTWGGVEARTLDGRVVVVNTLEARLEQARESLRPIVMPLFETQAEPWASMTMPTRDFAR